MLFLILSQVVLYGYDVRKFEVHGDTVFAVSTEKAHTYLIKIVSDSFISVNTFRENPGVFVAGPLLNNDGKYITFVVILGSGNRELLSLNGNGEALITVNESENFWLGDVMGKTAISERLQIGDMVFVVAIGLDGNPVSINIVDPYGYIVSSGVGAAQFTAVKTGNYSYVLRGNGKVLVTSFKFQIF